MQGFIALTAAICGPFFLSLMLKLTAEDFVAQQMHDDLQRLGAHLAHDERGWRTSPGLTMGPAYDDADGSRSYVAFDDQGAIVAMSARRFPVTLNDIPRQPGEHHLSRGSIDFSVELVTLAHGRLWLAVSQDRRHPDVIVDDVIASFLRRFIWVIPFGIAISLGLTLLFLRHATNTIEAVATTADAIDANRLHVRLDTTRLPTEVRPIAIAVNRALERVHDSYDAQREFVANVAHELRTPIATISLQAESIDDPALRARLEESVSRASHVVTQLMALANIEDNPPSIEQVDLFAAATVAVTDSALLVFKSGRSLELADHDVSAALVKGSMPLIRIAIANLIDNATRHTPEGTRISVSIVDATTLAVDDDGPGIAMSDRNRARSRYWRADSNRTDSAGLGLSIVERAMHAQAGTLRIDTSPLGGARMLLSFPPA